MARYEDFSVTLLRVKDIELSGRLTGNIVGQGVTGDVWYVSSVTGAGGVDATGYGKNISTPFATLAYALAAATGDNGDVIILLPGHAETLAATLAWTYSGMTVVSDGVGALAATFTGNAADEDIFISGDDNVLAGCIFKHITANSTGMIDIGGTGNKIIGNIFELGANALLAITVVDTADDTSILDNEYIVTANGPDKAIAIEKSTTAGPARLKIIGNKFNGMNATNAWDDGCIESSGVHTNCEIVGNQFQYGAPASKGCIEFTAAATGIIANNNIGGTTVASVLDPGSCGCFQNWCHDMTADETAIVLPATTPT